MSRQRFLEALLARGGGVAVAPLIQEHAARVEALSPQRLLMDPEALARALRQAQRLYAHDAVTVGGDGAWLAIATWIAAAGIDTMTARENVTQTRRLEADLPVAEAILRTEPSSTMVEAVRRLRPVLGERAGVALVLPSAGRLRRLLALDDARTSFADDTVMAALHALGPLELDGLLVTCDTTSEADALQPVAAFYGTALVALPAASAPADGVCVLSADRPAEWAGRQDARHRLYTTCAEVPTEVDSGTLRDAIRALRDF